MNHDSFTSVTISEEDAKAGKYWDNSKYYGASVLAFTKLMTNFDYQLVYVEITHTNAFFVANSELNNTNLALLS